MQIKMKYKQKSLLKLEKKKKVSNLSTHKN